MSQKGILPGLAWQPSMDLDAVLTACQPFIAGPSDMDVATFFQWVDVVAHTKAVVQNLESRLGFNFKGRAMGAPVHCRSARYAGEFRKQNSSRRPGKLAILGHLQLHSSTTTEKMQSLKTTIALEKPFCTVLDVEGAIKTMEDLASGLGVEAADIRVHAYSFVSLGLPVEGQRTLVVISKKALDLQKLVLDFCSVLNSLKLESILKQYTRGSHEGPCAEYEKEMLRRAFLAKQRKAEEVEESTTEPGTGEQEEEPAAKRRKKTLDEITAELFAQRWLPAPTYSLTKQSAAMVEALPKQSILIQAHACIMQYKRERREAPRLLVSDAGSSAWKTLRLQENSLPEVRPSSEFLVWGERLELLTAGSVLACKGYKFLTVNLLSLAEQSAAVAECSAAPVGLLMLLAAKRCAE